MGKIWDSGIEMGSLFSPGQPMCGGWFCLPLSPSLSLRLNSPNSDRLPFAQFAIQLFLEFCALVLSHIHFGYLLLASRDILTLWRRWVSKLTFQLSGMLHCYYSFNIAKINVAAKLRISAFWNKKHNCFIFIRTYPSTFSICTVKVENQLKRTRSMVTHC